MLVSFVGTLVLIISCVPLTIAAQTAKTATVSGVVTDSQGARIGRAAIA